MTVDPPTAATLARSRHARLVDALEAAGVPYVYWKAHRGIARALAGGAKDLDLLVRPASLEDARACLARAGYKRFDLPSGAVPESEPWVAWDATADRLYCAHLHWGIHVGRPGLHEQTLPWTDALIGSLRRAPEGLAALSPEAELAVLAARGVFEPARWARAPERLSSEAAAELRVVRERVEPAALETLTGRLFGASGREAAALLSAQGFPGEAGWAEWRAFAREALAPHRAPFADARWRGALLRSMGSVAVRRALGELAEALPPPPTSRLRRPGGLLVAFVGPDGAGKSTLTEAVVGWLGELFATESLYLGRGEWVSRAQQAAAEVKWALLERLSDRSRPTDSGPADDDGRRQGDASPREQRVRWVRDASALALAERKHREIRRAEVMRRRGWILVTDRFPHPTERLCDGPAIVADEQDPAIRRGLSAVEHAVYRRITRSKPDLVFRLLLPVEESIRRKPDHRAEDVRAKLASAERAEFDAKIITLQANAPLDQVLRSVKTAVWELL